MNSKEIVRRTVAFERPIRLARKNDIRMVGFQPAEGFSPSEPGLDEWGCIWKSLHKELGDKGQVIFHPLKDWERFTNYRFPDPDAKGRFSAVSELKHNDPALWNEKYIVGDCGSGPMHLLDYLRGFENYLVDLINEPDRIESLLGGIFRFLEGVTRHYAALGVDAVFFTDDQAMQTGPLFSMDTWRKYFKPRYTKLCKNAHALGVSVYMHTCGNLSQHLPELMECGIDIIDNKQPDLWMMSDTVDTVRGRISFSTCLDIQSTMFNVKKDDIPVAVDRLIKRLSTREGGFIATEYAANDLALSSLKLQRMREAYELFRWDEDHQQRDMQSVRAAML